MQPCKQPECPELVDSGFCTDHGKEYQRDLRSRVTRQDIYNSKRWRILRRRKLKLNPICEECDTELATEVDHVVGVAENPELAFEISNLRSLCKSCHSSKTNKEVRERRY